MLLSPAAQHRVRGQDPKSPSNRTVVHKGSFYVYDPMFVLGSVKSIQNPNASRPQPPLISKEIGKQTLVLLDPRTSSSVFECLSEIIAKFL